MFAPGSANTQADDFFRTAVDACQRLGRRGILATKYPEQLPAKLAADRAALRLRAVQPAAAARGGAGPSRRHRHLRQGLASGLPQVVMPMAYDQLDNGLRLKRLGVGAIVRQRTLQAAQVAATLEQLLASPPVQEDAPAMGRQVRRRRDARSGVRAA